MTPADGATAAAATYYYAWLGASYQDPAKLTVNSVTSGQGWYSDGRITKHVNDTY